MISGKLEPLWTCPACGQRFVTRNMSHSCGAHALDDHFRGKDAAVRVLFDELVTAARLFGDVHVYAQKTRIVFQTRGRFVAITPRRHHLAGHLWLKRRREHPLFHRVDNLLDRDFVHHFKISTAAQCDESFRELLHEAFLAGSQTLQAGEKQG